MYNATMTVTIRKKGEFGDIRAELKARIDSIGRMASNLQSEFEKQQEKALSEHKVSMEAYKGALKSYRDMLELEEAFATHNVLHSDNKDGPAPGDVKIQMPAARLPLADFFCDKLRHLGPLTKGELRGLAQQAGYFNGDEGGRQTHATLVNIKRNGRVNDLEDGRFEFAEKENESLFK